MTTGALDDFKAVMLTRNESITGLAKVVAFLVIFALGVVAGLWVSAGAGVRWSPESIVPRSIVGFQGSGNGGGGGGGICCRPDLDPEFEEFVAPTRLMHDMTDKELFWRATLAPADASWFPNERVPKVAFMFLAGHGVLPLAPLWERFFRGGRADRFSIYVHAPPGVAINVSEDSPFYGRQIPSQKTEWGSVTLVDAEKRLLANALLDFSNERFVLLSESCIPVHNFTTVYDYLMGSQHSFVESYYRNDRGCRNRYNRHMAPDITLRQWRKGSQWLELARDLAASVVADTRYYRVFRRHCLAKHSCYPDEHYVQTFVALRHRDRNANRTVTRVEWRKGESHPVAYGAADATPELVRSIRRSAEPCAYNSGTTDTCYLFARKFTADALAPLLNMSSTVMHY